MKNMGIRQTLYCHKMEWTIGSIEKIYLPAILGFNEVPWFWLISMFRGDLTSHWWAMGAKPFMMGHPYGIELDLPFCPFLLRATHNRWQPRSSKELHDVACMQYVPQMQVEPTQSPQTTITTSITMYYISGTLTLIHFVLCQTIAVHWALQAGHPGRGVRVGHSFRRQLKCKVAEKNTIRKLNAKPWDIHKYKHIYKYYNIWLYIYIHGVYHICKKYSQMRYKWFWLVLWQKCGKQYQESFRPAEVTVLLNLCSEHSRWHLRIWEGRACWAYAVGIPKIRSLANMNMDPERKTSWCLSQFEVIFLANRSASECIKCHP